MDQEPIPGTAPTPAKKGLFAPKTPPPAPESAGASDKLNILASRVRVSEQRTSEIRNKILMIEHNMLTNHKKALTEIKSLQTQIMEMKHSMTAVQDRIITVIKELRLMASKEDVGVMKRYVELWNPMKFVSVDQVDRIIDEKLGKRRELPPPNYDSPS